jgi:multidrug efflux system membrane fusion protein
MKKTFLISIAGILLMVSCKEKPKQKLVDPAVMVKTADVSYEPFALPVQSSGLITSDKESRLSFKMGGILSRLLVNEGDNVVKGQLLARLNPTELDAQLEADQNTLEKARRDYARSEKLFKDSSATLEEYQNSKTGVRSALQNYKVAQFNKAFASVYANQSGRVIRKLVNEGEVVSPGSVVYIINSTKEDDWVVRLGVADKDWARIKLGDHAILTTDVYPDKQLDAIVSEVGEGADAATGTFLIKVKVQPGQIRLANGLAAKISIKPSAMKKYHFIPVDALIEANQETATVYSPRADGRTVEKHTVHIAYILGSRVAVNAGLEGVNKVITDGSAYLTPSSNIQIAPSQPKLQNKLNVQQ